MLINKENKMKDKVLRFVYLLDWIARKTEWVITNTFCLFLVMNFSISSFNVSQATIKISELIELNVNTLLYVGINLSIACGCGIAYKWFARQIESEWTPISISKLIASILSEMIPSLDKSEINDISKEIATNIMLIITTILILLTMVASVVI
ncbi:hypothetical protein [Clostridioides difficile]|uniref:hypothetical protein n=1 Tax=Clostridioides difficile TaxID=1496 RepID=UPI000D1DEDE2|nr:hypothetical protein [Clostridioides difficile]